MFMSTSEFPPPGAVERRARRREQDLLAAQMEIAAAMVAVSTARRADREMVCPPENPLNRGDA